MLYLNSDIARDNASIQCLADTELQSLNNQTEQVFFDKDLPKITILNSINIDEYKNLYSCYILSKNDFIDTWIRGDLDKKFSELSVKFFNSLQSKSYLFENIQSEIIENAFQTSLSRILEIFPETISVGVSDDECAYIYFEKDGKSVYFDLFFEPGQPAEASVTVFVNRKSILSFTDNVDNSIEKLNNEFVPKDELSYSPFA